MQPAVLKLQDEQVALPVHEKPQPIKGSLPALAASASSSSSFNVAVRRCKCLVRRWTSTSKQSSWSCCVVSCVVFLVHLPPLPPAGDPGPSSRPKAGGRLPDWIRIRDHPCSITGSCKNYRPPPLERAPVVHVASCFRVSPTC